MIGEANMASPGAMAASNRRLDDATDCHGVSPRGLRPQPRDGGRAGGSYGALEPAAERAQELLHREFFCPVAGLCMLARPGCQPAFSECTLCTHAMCTTPWRVTDLGEPSTTAGRRRRWQQAGGVALAVAALCLAASAEWSGMMGRGVQGLRRSVLSAADAVEGEPDMIDAEKTPHQNPYCSVFADPSECEKQMQDGMYKTWSEDEVRQELWKTMKALAELELREHSHHQEHTAKAEEQRQVGVAII